MRIPNILALPPRADAQIRYGPVYGLASERSCALRPVAFPCRSAQWPSDRSTLAYRCGGSDGFAKRWRTIFPFHPFAG